MKLNSCWTLAISFALALSAHAAAAPESLLGFGKGGVTSLFQPGGVLEAISQIAARARFVAELELGLRMPKSKPRPMNSITDRGAAFHDDAQRLRWPLRLRQIIFIKSFSGCFSKTLNG